MNSTRVMLTIEHRLQSQLLKHVLAKCPELEIVGEATDVIECMVMMSATKPDLWVHSWEESPELEAVLSHVYDHHPQLMVFRMNPNESAGYMQLQVNSLDEMLGLATQFRQLSEARHLTGAH